MHADSLVPVTYPSEHEDGLPKTESTHSLTPYPQTEHTPREKVKWSILHPVHLKLLVVKYVLRYGVKVRSRIRVT